VGRALAVVRPDDADAHLQLAQLVAEGGAGREGRGTLRRPCRDSCYAQNTS
jgi:hypothetical protein